MGTPPVTAPTVKPRPRFAADQVQRGPGTPTDLLLIDTLRHIYQLATRFYPYPPGVTLTPSLTAALSAIANIAETTVQAQPILASAGTPVGAFVTPKPTGSTTD